MAFDFIAASSQYLTATLASSLGTPFSFAAYAKTTDMTNALVVISTNNTSNSYRNMLYLSGSDDKVYASVVAGIGTDAVSTTTYTSGADLRIAAVFTSDISRAAYLNGGGKGTNATNSTTGAISTVAIGGRFSTTWGAFMDGNIAESAIWSAALTDDEVASLAKGFKPYRIRPQSLVFYAPLIRDLQDTKGGLALTNNNAATVADHPRVY